MHRHFEFSNSSRKRRRFQNRLQQAAAVGLGDGELGFELVAHGHEFINFGDDAVLFGEWQQSSGCVRL